MVNCDYILVLVKGKVVEQGTDSELLSDQWSLYSALWYSIA